MNPVAIAAPSELAAEAGAAVAADGGNAVDAALAAAAAAMVTEPGVAAPGAGAFVTIWPASGPPRVYDGYMAVPGLGGRHPDPVEESVSMEYGGGVVTLVGPASIAVPGAWAAFGDAHADHGASSWRAVLEPSIAMAAAGTPLGATSAHYLEYSHEAVFGRDPVGRAALERPGHPVGVGDTVRVDGLAETLGRIADAGADDVYRGDVAAMIAGDIRERGGHLSRKDLMQYRCVVRPPLRFRLGSWDLASNPPPAVGGVALASVLRFAAGDGVDAMIEAQRRVFEWRRRDIDSSPSRDEGLVSFLQRLPGDPVRSPSTAHISCASADGTVCAVTLSAGYGSGIIPEGTGMWMNNAMGESELVGDRSRLVPGTRLNSNMAPTVGRSEDGARLAIGSPGADRITTALAQTLAGLEAGLDPQAAIAAPRVHVDVDVSGVVTVACEPGVDPASVGSRIRGFDGIHMYFGGVGLAMTAAAGTTSAFTDPRRNGAVRIA